MDSADGKGGSSSSDLSASKKIEAGELSASKRIESKHSLDDDIKNICEKGTIKYIIEFNIIEYNWV